MFMRCNGHIDVVDNQAEHDACAEIGDYYEAVGDDVLEHWKISEELPRKGEGTNFSQGQQD